MGRQGNHHFENKRDLFRVVHEQIDVEVAILSLLDGLQTDQPEDR